VLSVQAVTILADGMSYGLFDLGLSIKISYMSSRRQITYMSHYFLTVFWPSLVNIQCMPYDIKYVIPYHNRYYVI